MDYLSQVELSENGAFQARVRQAALAHAIFVFQQKPVAGELPVHEARAKFGAQVLANPTGIARALAMGVASWPAMTDAATDNDIGYIVAQMWNAWSGVLQAPDAPPAKELSEAEANAYLAESPAFQARVRQAAIAQAMAILAAEPEKGADEAVVIARAELAKQVVTNPDGWQRVMSMGVASNAAISEAATDADIAWTVAQMWDAWAGVYKRPVAVEATVEEVIAKPAAAPAEAPVTASKRSRKAV